LRSTTRGSLQLRVLILLQGVEAAELELTASQHHIMAILMLERL